MSTDFKERAQGYDSQNLKTVIWRDMPPLCLKIVMLSLVFTTFHYRTKFPGFHSS